jgi:hypothetical protein
LVADVSLFAEIPPFAAYLAFELYTWPDDHTGERAFVKVVYNGEPLGLPGCQANGQCEFAGFEQLLRESTSPNWYEACGAEICFEKDLVLDVGAAKKNVGGRKALPLLIEESRAQHDSSHNELQLKKRKLDEAATNGEAEEKERRVGGLEFIMLATGLMLGFSAVPLKNLLFPPAPATPPKLKRSKSLLTNGQTQASPRTTGSARRAVSVKSCT